MENCLVTQLKAAVQNDNLIYLDFLHINVQQEDNVNANDFSINVSTSTVSKLYIEGDGHFTDGTLTEDRGKEANTGTNLKFSNGNYVLKIPLMGITSLGVGSAQMINITKWQNRGLDYERLCKVNKDTLTQITFDDEEKLIACAPNMINVTVFNLICYSIKRLEPILEAIVESSGRTVNFSFYGNKLRDIYTPASGNFMRNIHVTSNTQYSVYNQADTELLYTAQKVNGVWTHTLAQ